MNRNRVDLRFTHPTRDLRFLSDVLGLRPFTSWLVGEPWRAPYGQPMKNIINKESYWVAPLDPEPDERIDPLVRRAIDLFKQAETTIRDLTSTGGKATIYIWLAGDINDGCEIEPPLLAFMADLGAALYIEVVPNRRPD